MKNQRKIKRGPKTEGVAIISQSVGMERKQDVVLIKSSIDKMTEDEIRELLLSISNENKKLHEIYYPQNTPIMQIRRRTFFDLLKKFIEVTEGKMNCQTIEISTSYRKK